MINISTYIPAFATLTDLQNQSPWEITQDLPNILLARIPLLGNEYVVKDNIAIHHTAIIESNVTIKAPAIIGKDCFIGANSYLRNGVWLLENVKIGTG